MPKKFRLSRADFSYIKGFRRVQNQLFSLAYGDIPGRRVSGGAVIVSNKVSKSAVRRNRIKRHVRNTISEVLKRSGISKILVVTAKKASDAASADEIRTSLQDLSTQIT